MSDFETEIAKQVILPKLQQAVTQSKEEVTSKAQLRKMFNEVHGVSLSAAKFEEYLSLLNIKFTKRVVIEGLYPEAPPRPSAGAEAPEEEDFRFDNEKERDNPNNFRGVNSRDMFGLA